MCPPSSLTALAADRPGCMQAHRRRCAARKQQAGSDAAFQDWLAANPLPRTSTASDQRLGLGRQVGAPEAEVLRPDAPGATRHRVHMNDLLPALQQLAQYER